MKFVFQFFRRVGNSSKNFTQPSQLDAVLAEVSQKRIIFFGENHEDAGNIQLQHQILRCMRDSRSNPSIHVVLEHFSFEMQHLLAQYQRSEISLEELQTLYEDIGTESHAINAYASILEYAREESDVIRLHGGFIPRNLARKAMKAEDDSVFNSLVEKGYVPSIMMEGSEEHYGFFESLITGNPKLSNRFRKIFKAQILKDSSMANYVNKLVKTEPESSQFLVIAGRGHIQHDFGVPERVYFEHPSLKSDSLTIIHGEGMRSFPPELPPAADIIFDVEDVKAETAEVYNKVGASAHLKGNLKRAHAVMNFLNYTEEQIEFAGEDAYNFQGVGNPHLLAKIQPGERVLDIGSGLGVDSFLAFSKTGRSGIVFGVDIAKNEIDHASTRSVERNISENIKFIEADMEKLPFEDETFDCCISNGAFCLAPNKEQAFREAFRVLKPGGRISICTSTIQSSKLPDGIEWPICMRMFIPIEEIKPLCESLGFENVVIDQENSEMMFEIEEDEEMNELNPKRTRIHVGSDEFKHLEKFDMDQLCARVVVYAEKPVNS